MENQKLEQCFNLEHLINIQELEKKIIECFSKEQKLLLDHFRHANIVSRKADECGYFANIKTNPTRPKIQVNGFTNSLNLFLNGVVIGGAMIYIENGLLSMIECYSWDDNDIFMKLLSNTNKQAYL